MAKLKPQIVVPVIGPSGLYGLILVGAKVLEEQYSPGELGFLDRLMSSFRLPFKTTFTMNIRFAIRRQACSTTGFFMVRLNEELARCQRTERVVHLL
jgi:hypothetical protein